MQQSEKRTPGLSVHEVLAQGYLAYLAAIVVGFGITYFWPDPISFPNEAEVGFAFIVLGTLLAYWAQRSSGRTAAARNAAPEMVCRDQFCVGPYRYTRSPTQYALFLMAFGLSLVFGSLYMVIGSVFAFLLGKFYIIPRQEQHLEARFGEPYLEYKRSVKL